MALQLIGSPSDERGLPQSIDFGGAPLAAPLKYERQAFPCRRATKAVSAGTSEWRSGIIVGRTIVPKLRDTSSFGLQQLSPGFTAGSLLIGRSTVACLVDPFASFAVPVIRVAWLSAAFLHLKILPREPNSFAIRIRIYYIELYIGIYTAKQKTCLFFCAWPILGLLSSRAASQWKPQPASSKFCSWQTLPAQTQIFVTAVKMARPSCNPDLITHLAPVNPNLAQVALHAMSQETWTMALALETRFVSNVILMHQTQLYPLMLKGSQKDGCYVKVMTPAHNLLRAIQSNSEILHKSWCASEQGPAKMFGRSTRWVQLAVRLLPMTDRLATMQHLIWKGMHHFAKMTCVVMAVKCAPTRLWTTLRVSFAKATSLAPSPQLHWSVTCTVMRPQMRMSTQACPAAHVLRLPSPSLELREVNMSLTALGMMFVTTPTSPSKRIPPRQCFVTRMLRALAVVLEVHAIKSTSPYNRMRAWHWTVHSLWTVWASQWPWMAGNATSWEMSPTPTMLLTALQPISHSAMYLRNISAMILFLQSFFLNHVDELNEYVCYIYYISQALLGPSLTSN